MRLVNYGTLVAPYDLCACADVGDVPVNPINVQDTLRRIEAYMTASAPGRRHAALHRRRPHHLLSDPAGAWAPSSLLGMIHVDAHSDTGDTYFGGQKLTHGTPFRRAIEDGVLDPKRMVQIGIRGTMYSADERQWALDQGIRIIDMEEVAEKGIPYAIAEARKRRRHGADLFHVRHRFHRSGLCARYRHAGNRRLHQPRGAAARPRLPPPQPRRRRHGGSLAAARPDRQARRSSARPSPSSCFACWPRRAASNARERCGSMWLKTRIRCHSGASETRARNP